MIRINENYTKLKASYLFSDIAKRVSAYVAAHPTKPVIRLGIGDVTEPLPPVCVEALHAATDEMAKRATFKGYGPEQGYAFLRETVAAPVPIVFGIMRDKAIGEVLETLAPVASLFVCTAPVSPTAAAPAELVALATAVAPAVPCVAAHTPREALMLAAGHGSPIVVAGSLFLAGEVLPLLA